MTQQVMALCGAMGAGEGREELLLPLARAVCGQLAERLQEGFAPEDCGPAFPLAAAMLVMDQLAEISGSRELTTFTAGELTIRQEAGNGRSLASQAERLLAPWLRDSSFCFQGVEG